MKKITALLTLVLFLFSSLLSFAQEDPRLELREGDDAKPTPEGLFFTRYTPWLKSFHMLSEAEKENNKQGGEACQQIRALDIFPGDSNFVIFGTDTSGVWISENAGENWYNATRNIPTTDISDVMWHPTDKNVILVYTVATKTGSIAPGIYRTENMGRSWERVHADYISSNKESVTAASTTDNLFDYDDCGNLYAVTAKGIIKSSDKGKNWSFLKTATETTNSAQNRVYASSIDVSDDGKTIVACYADDGFSLNGMNISRDGGKSWDKLYFSSDKKDWETYSFVMGEFGYIAGTYNPGSGTYEIYVSENDGESWRKFASEKATYKKVRNDKAAVRIRVNKDSLYVTYSTSDTNLRALSLSELENAETTSAWKSISLSGAGKETFSGGKNMYFPQGFDFCETYMMACAGGPNKYSYETQTWERKSGGFTGLLVNHFNMDSSGNMVISRTDGGLVTSDGPYTKNNIPTFSKMDNSGGTIATRTAFDPNDSTGNRLICWYGNSNTSKTEVGIIVTEDKGRTYVDYDSVSGKYNLRYKDPLGMNSRVLEYDKDDSSVIYSSGAISRDNAQTWVQNEYYIMDISNTDSDKMVAWDVYGDNPTYRLMYSDDRGGTWTRLSNAGTFASGSEIGVVFDVEDENKIWFKTMYRFGYLSVDEGGKITELTGRTPFNCYGGIVQNPKAANHLLLMAKNFGTTPCPTLYESYDYGHSWHVVPGLFGRRDLTSIKFSETTDEVFLGSHNGTVIYEYNKFKYYKGLRLKNKDEYIYVTVDLFNGEITAPEEIFDAPEMTRFKGWKYKKRVYRPGQKIKVE